jgi:16S rRNA (guanine527-N7)-methyltransferase
LQLSNEQINQLLRYKDLLIKWNKTFSLTAITKSEEIIVNHILDGLSIVNYFQDSKNICDVGSGMGVPAIILAIALPTINITALDSNHKKTSFLLQVKIELGLKNLTVVNSRVELFKPITKFDIITSRAFANMELFIELTQHLLITDGYYLAMKSQQGLSEVLHLTNWQYENIELKVPYLSAHRFLIKLHCK